MPLRYKHGQTLMIDYTPAVTAVAEGNVVGFGVGDKTVGICHRPIEAGRKGALSVPNGSAIYEADKADVTDAFTIGDLVEIDISKSDIVPAGDADGDGLFGRCVESSGANVPTVLIQPIPSLVDMS